MVACLCIILLIAFPVGVVSKNNSWFEMKSKIARNVSRSQRWNQDSSEGLNWVLIVSGAVLTTLSIKIGCKLLQAITPKTAADTSSNLKENANFSRKGGYRSDRPLSGMYCFEQSEDGSSHCFSGISDGLVDMKPLHSPMSRESDLSLPLTTIPLKETPRQNGHVRASSPEQLELLGKPFYSNCSDSPCVSECGSDVFSKKEVLQKLRQQLKRRDEMILEMQFQISELQDSSRDQISKYAQLQSQFDSANRVLFDSTKEIQRLRKVVADHCVTELKPTKKLNPGKPIKHGHVNGFRDLEGNLELHIVEVDRREESLDRCEILKKEVVELNDVIAGKDFLLQTYKDQQSELHSTIKELQMRLASQVPSIL